MKMRSDILENERCAFDVLLRSAGSTVRHDTGHVEAVPISEATLAIATSAAALGGGHSALKAIWSTVERVRTRTKKNKIKTDL